MKKAIQQFLKGHSEKGFELLNQLEILKLDAKSKAKIHRVLDIMVLGELYGLHTISSILSVLHIKSNNLHKIWQGINHRQIQLFVEHFSVEGFREALVELAKKDPSAWSRARVTIVIDDSIFKQWLKNMPIGGAFAKFFSGQTHSTVYGFRITLIGVALGDTFYPLYFQLSPKGTDTKEVALKFLKKVYQLLSQIAEEEHISYPNLALSVDSGFTDLYLIAYCESKNIQFIGVAKKSFIFQIGRYRLNLKKYIEQIYLKKERAYLDKCEAEGKTPQPFLLRKKAHFQALKQTVILVMFRLNGSNKVTVIFTSALEATAKTLRRRFFQRTKIELFFRLLKDTLKIQTSKCVDAESFLKKLNLFIYKAIICYDFKKYCNRHFRIFRGWAFTKLRLHIIYERIELSLLEDLVKSRGFCNQNTHN